MLFTVTDVSATLTAVSSPLLLQHLTWKTIKELIENKLDVILEEIGLTKQSFDGSVKDYRLSGAYRKLFVKPNGILGRVIEYS